MSIFGPSQKETWTKLSEEIKADFVKGGVFRTHKIVTREKLWTITLDTFAVHTGKATIPFTRLRAPFFNKENFRFKLERRNFFSPVADFFGRKSLLTSFPEFDKHFVIDGKDDYKLKKLFANQTIRELVMNQKEIHLEIKDDEGWLGTKFPADVDELYLQLPGIVKDGERLKAAFTLFREVLNQLVEIGSAYERDPIITLK
ncbi:MAG TPA: DUF3137 domain-containing protein [Cyclobacteriaceae bacterium]|nr:DUF3137 domain-containing protein [Cyclobacteriaceae bacterium]